MDISLAQNAAQLKIDPAVYLRILKLALAQTDSDLSTVARALEQNDQAVIQTISHRWKGDFANLRLDSLSATAQQINAHAKAGADLILIKAIYERFLLEFQELKNQVAGIKPG